MNGFARRMFLATLICFLPVGAAAGASTVEVEVGAEKTVAEGELLGAPKAAFLPGTYLVVWQEGWPGLNATADIMGVRLKPGTLKPLDDKPLKICVAKEAQYRPAVAAGEGVFLVVWQDFRNGRDLDVRGVLVDAGTGRHRGEEIEIARGPHNQARPAVAWTGKNFVVVWQEIRGRDVYGICGRGISATGKPLAEKSVVSEKGASPVVCASAGKVLVTWSNGRGTSAVFTDPVSLKPRQLLGFKGVINPRCGDGTAVVGDGKGNFMTVSAREGFPNPWGWPGPGCVLCSRVKADGSAPESKLKMGYRLNNVCGRVIPNVVDTATWGKSKQWHAGAPGGFKGTADGLWPNGRPAVAVDGKGGLLFAWVKGEIAPDRLNLHNLDIWLRGMNGKTLAVTVADRKIAAAPDAEETAPVMLNGPDGEILLVYERTKTGEKKRVAARKITVK